MNTSLRIISFNCKNIKTCGPVLHKLFIKNDIILIQEHWLFQAQIHLIGELHSQINYAAKGVDINDPLLPISMPRGYRGVAVIWKNEIDHLVRPIQDGSEKIQAVEIQGKAGDRLLLISVYMPAKGSKNHQIEYHDCVDQLYELYQKYRDSHTIVIGGDMNEDLNNPISNKRNQYLLDFIRETQLAYNNSSKTFVNSMGQETSEIDYFLHNIKEEEYLKKTVLQNLPENTSDHHPIKLSIDFEYSLQPMKQKVNKPGITKVKWEKVDKEWYEVILRENISSIKHKLVTGDIPIGENILKICEIMKSAAITSSSNQAIFRS